MLNTDGRGSELRGRRSESKTLDGLLADARKDHSGVVVVRGEAGVGKTALLDYLAERAHGFRIVRAVGIESEMELAYAGLHQLCAPLLDGLAGLPPPQRDALSTAFGISAGEPPDRFLVGLAVLSLVSEVAEGQPLLWIVDDARIEEGFLRRLEPLPVETRRVLLTAAAEPGGDDALLWRAVGRLGIGHEAAAAAEATGLIELGTRVRFRHPLVRSAAYRSASLLDRQDIHRALAEVTDPDLDPDRRAWHRAHAAVGPDEGVAAELERSADRAQARGGMAAAAAFLEEAVRLTLDPALRAERALAAAQAKYDAGSPEAALALISMAQAGPFDELRSARVGLLRAEIAFATRRGSDAPPLLLKAGRQLEPLDIGLARETYLEAFTAAVIVGRLSRGADVVEVAKAALAAPLPSTPARAPDILLDGLALLVTDGRATATPILKHAVSAFRNDDLSTH